MTFGTMATQSALIGGFAYGGLTIEIKDSVHGLLSFSYLSTTALSMGFSLLAITIATFVFLLLINIVYNVWSRIGT